MPPRPPFLADELVEEVLLRLPPEEPAWLVRSSAVCKPWRRILAAPRFRRRYREFHGTPPVLGLFQQDGRFVPTSALLPAQPHRARWTAVPWTAAHGRALFDAANRDSRFAFNLIVLDPLTRHRHRVPWPVLGEISFSAAVLCAAHGGCDHHGCQGGPFLVVFVATDQLQRVTSGWVYSSETRAWSKLATSVIEYKFNMGAPSVLVGDSLYFNVDGNGVLECQLGTLRLSMFEKPVDGDGALMAGKDGGLGFAAVVDVTDLTLWSMETRPEGAMGWAKLRVIDLMALLLDGALLNPTLEFGIGRSPDPQVSGFAEGTQAIFVSTCVGSYMVDLKSGRARKVSCGYGGKLFPYTRFYIPAMEAACTGHGQ